MIFFLLFQYALFHVVCSISQHPVLIIVSYDAFRYNYFDKNVSHNMVALREKGTYADHMINVFPTKTFPNHQSISTGLYPENHGVVGNSFRDPLLREIVRIGPEMYSYSNEITPIWTLNEMEGKGRHSGSMMWPGAKFPYRNNKNITYVEDWNPTTSWKKRVDIVLSWIKNPERPANLVMLYFEEPDTQAHKFGPESDVVLNLLKELDDITKYLYDQIKASHLENVVNVVHLSDHGMSTVTPPNIIDITKFLRKDTYEIADTSPCLQIWPTAELEDDIYIRLKNASRDIGHFTVFKKKDLPSIWHFKNNRRTPPLFVLAEESYGFQDLLESAKNYSIIVKPTTTFGVHGYDNIVKDMHPFFMARGPRIKQGHKVPPFHTVDLYNFFCDILSLKPAPNNGTFANVRDILTTAPPASNISPIGIAVGAVIAALLLISLGAAMTLIMIKRQQNITTTAALNKRFPQTFNKSSSIEAQHLLDHEEA